jgi:predicted transcriptional regulator
LDVQEATAAAEPDQPKLTPAQIRKSITADAILSFEDGKPTRL